MGFHTKKIALLMFFLFNISLVNGGESSLSEQIGSYKKAILMPILNFSTNYVDNTKIKPEKFILDSTLGSFLEQYSFFNAKKCLNPISYDSLAKDDSLFLGSVYIKSDSSTFSHLAIFQKAIKRVATENGADIVVVIPRFNLTKKAFKPKGWREAQPYEQPVKNYCTGNAIIQFWNSEGTLLTEISKDIYLRKPFFKKIFEKKGIDSDLLEYSKKFYAPPILKGGVKLMNSVYGL